MRRHESDHGVIDQRVHQLEEELAQLRQRRLEVYALWWNKREDRDRSRHLARRLRRRLRRAQRRYGFVGGQAEA